MSLSDTNGEIQPPTVIPVRARWQRPSGRPMWGDYEYALVIVLPDREVVFQTKESES